MDLKDLMAISGYPGLFRFISQGRNSIIVESLEDKKRMSAYSTSKINTLEEIAIFTETDEVPLKDVFTKMYDHNGGGEAINHKSPAGEIKDYFGKVLPEYDRERVYVSDMKKVINWYNLLIKYELFKPEAEDKDETPDSGTGKQEDKQNLKPENNTENKTEVTTEAKPEAKPEAKSEETTKEKKEEKRKNPPKGE